MRSKTTVGGPSLSACRVIALGGGKKRKKKEERGGGGTEGKQAVAALEPGVCAVCCSDLVWRGAALAPGLLTPALPRHSQSKY